MMLHNFSGLTASTFILPAVLLSSGVSMPTHAVPITFDFSHNVAQSDALSHPALIMEQQGLTLTVSAQRNSGRGLDDFSSAEVTQWEWGLGVSGGYHGQLDARSANERLSFGFDQNVILQQISFGLFDDNDQAQLMGVDWENPAVVHYDNSTALSPTHHRSVQFSDLPLLSFLGIGAESRLDNITIASLTVDFSPEPGIPNPSPVVTAPEPASGLLLASGLLGAGFLRRRKSS